MSDADQNDGRDVSFHLDVVTEGVAYPHRGR
jgi:hypothetical protein